MQYAATNSYKSDSGIQYAPSSYKPNYEGSSQYASSAYRGPFIVAGHQVPVGQTRGPPRPFYSSAPVHHTPPSALALPLNYGRNEQPLSAQPQPHQQNHQYAIAFPAEYFRHYQQNLATPYPLHGAQMVQLVYTHSAGPQQPESPADVKDQQYKHGAIHYVSLAPPQDANAQVVRPAVITHIIPYYGSGGHHQHQVQQLPPAAFYYKAHSQQMPQTSLTFNTPAQQQHIIHKQQIYGPIPIAVASVPLKPMIDPAQQQQLQQQSFNQFYHHYHPGAQGYIRYSQSPSASHGSGSSSNPVEVPAHEAGSSSSSKERPLYSSSTSTNPGNTYSGSSESNGGKMAYTYGTDPNNEGSIYAHPGSIQYGTHLYHPSRNIVQIGSNRVTAGSAAIAGVSSPSYHPQQQSAVNNSHGSRGSSSSVVKFV